MARASRRTQITMPVDFFAAICATGRAKLTASPGLCGPGDANQEQGSTGACPLPAGGVVDDSSGLGGQRAANERALQSLDTL